jgi:hypothetical protein
VGVVFANNGDFDAYRPRLARYHRGVDDTTVVAALEALHTLYADVGRREARLAELGAKKVTPRRCSPLLGQLPGGCSHASSWPMRLHDRAE